MGFWVGIKKIVNGIVNVGRSLVEGVVNIVKRTYDYVKEKLIQYFNEVKDYLKIVAGKICGIMVGILVGAAHCIRKVGDKFQEVSQNFFIDKERGKWNVKEVVRKIEFSALPPDVQEEMKHKEEHNDTKRVNEALVCIA